MPRRYYSSTAVETTLTSNVSNSATTLPVASTSGFPAQTPYTLILDEGTVNEEIVTVTAVATLNLTVTRGQDGTSAVSHSNGGTVKHGVSARDFDEANAHVNDTTTNPHNVTATQVGAVANSLVNAKGDLITATANDTPAILTAGSNGQMLMADSSATAGLRYVDPPANRNLIINGAMQVAQRGTSSTGISATQFGYYTADRWQFSNQSGSAVFTQSVESDAPSESGLSKSIKILATTGQASLSANNYVLFQTGIEGQDLQRIAKGTASAQQMTVSFWVKSNVTGTYIAELVDQDNARKVSAAYSIASSGTWERKAITFPADSSGALDNDNALSFNLTMWLAAGSTFTSGTLNTSWTASTPAGNRTPGQTNLAAATNNYWQVTGVQLETGPVATPFEFEPYEATLRKCQRYYYRIAPNATSTILGSGFVNGATEMRGHIPFPVEMRTAPTALEQSGTAGDYQTLTGSTTVTACSGVPVFSTASKWASAINLSVASGLTTGQGGQFRTAGTAAYLAWSAEL